MEPLASGLMFPDEPTLVTIKIASTLELAGGTTSNTLANVALPSYYTSCLVTGSLTVGLQVP